MIGTVTQRNSAAAARPQPGQAVINRAVCCLEQACWPSNTQIATLSAKWHLDVAGWLLCILGMDELLSKEYSRDLSTGL
jgi:hypothetical protein